ncbi:MAG: DUF5915 domain-containing protein, partial [Rhodoluna sp.]
AAGPRIGKDVQAVIQAAKAGNWSETDGKVIAGGIELAEGEYEIDLVADTSKGNSEVEVTEHIGILPSGGFLILDAKVTAELAAEGLARDVIRAIQQSRKDANLDVSDRIKLVLSADADVLAAVSAHEELVKGETLTLELETKNTSNLNNPVAVGDDQQVEILVAKL